MEVRPRRRFDSLLLQARKDKAWEVGAKDTSKDAESAEKAAATAERKAAAQAQADAFQAEQDAFRDQMKTDAP